MAIRIILFVCLFTLIDLFLITKASIVWELETIPAVFGKDVVLKCTLPQNCCKIKQSRRWLGGDDLHLLTMNGFSIDTAKYSEKFNEENKTSILTIHTFDIEDINIPYECIYGSSTFVKILNWTEDIFESTMIWELETIPAVFGKDVILKCTLPQNCCKNMQSRRWLGGNDLHLLSMNGFSIDTDKYSEDFNNEKKASILIIRDFDIMDINVPYECIYGSSTFVKILNLTEDTFEYHTSGPYIENITITETNMLSVKIVYERVYPRPNCSSAIHDEDISSYMTTTTILKGLFFFAIITVTYLLTPASCPGLLSISCNIGTYLFVYETNITCNKIVSDKNQEIPSMNPAVTIILSVTVCFLLLAACVVFIKTRPQDHSERSGAEEHPLNEMDTVPMR